MICPSCATTNPDEAKFCMNCGTRLSAGNESTSSTGGQANTKPAKPSIEDTRHHADPYGSEFLARYLPPELMVKLDAARRLGAMSGERRVITMLFCDIKGSTAAAEQVDPETWSEIMNGAFERMIAPIYRYEGVVPRLMGDAILAFFGAPIAHEDDPQRAVWAGLDIQAAMQPYADKMRGEYGLDFGLRVGINTGLVVVGEIGSDLRMEYTAIGDAINLAARMEQTALPGTVQITEETHKLIAPLFDFEPLGGIEVKGKAEPVTAYRVLGRKADPGRLRGVQGLSSPLVGRDEPLQALRSRLEALKSGEGSFVAVIGEAGLGKSSLVAEVQKEESITPQPDREWLRGEGVAHSRSVSYFPWRQIVRHSVEAREDDPPADVRERLRGRCEALGLPADDIPFLEVMLGIEGAASREAVAAYQGEALVEHMSEAACGFLTALARVKPLVLVFDDLHWADEASLQLLRKASALVGSQPLLFICMLRPERDAPSWSALQEVQQGQGGRCISIELQPLASEQTGALLKNLLGMQELPTGLRARIIEKAGGNPFFIEELIRSLMETGQIVRDEGHWRAAGEAFVTVPDTLRGVLDARIDRLPEAERHTLQMAAVIGRIFNLRVLERLARVEDLDAHIARLGQAGLVEGAEKNLTSVTDSAEIDRGIVMTFRHALIQEAAYESILLKRRGELHRQVGESLEELHAGRIEEFAPLLAYHFYQARDERSLKYDLLAGDKAARLYANVEAATHYRRALETAKRIGAETRQLGEIYSKLGGVLELNGRYTEALKTYEEMQRHAHGQSVPSMELQALMALGTIYATPTALRNPAMAEKTMIEALELSRAVGDVTIQTRLNWNLMLNSLHARRTQEAFQYGQRALELARQGGDQEQLAFVLNDLGRVLITRGQFDEAIRLIHEARGLWSELDNQVMLADNLGAEEEALYSMGRFHDGLRIGRQALEICDAMDNGWGQSYHRLLMGLAEFGRGNAQAAIPLMTEAIEMGDRGGLIISSIAGRCDLAWCYGAIGDIDKGLSLLEPAIQTARANLPDWVVMPIAIQVRLHALRGDRAAAEEAAKGVNFVPPSLAYAHYTMMVELARVELKRLRGDYEGMLEAIEEITDELRDLLPAEMPHLMECRADALRALGGEAEFRVD